MIVIELMRVSWKKRYNILIKNIKVREQYWYSMADKFEKGSENWIMFVKQANVLTNLLQDYVENRDDNEN